MDESRIKREQDFHDQVFDDGGRSEVGKFYSVTGSAGKRYSERALFECAGKRVLELGCGPGSLAFLLAEHGAKVVGIDISPVAIRQATETARSQDLDCTFVEMNAEALTFEDQSFDIICGSGILHHLDLEKIYAELQRVLKTNGRAVFFEPLGHNWLLRFYRWLTPKLRTPDEHPILMKDLVHAAQHFRQVQPEYFVFLTLFLFPFRRFGFFDRLLARTENLERALFNLLPFLKKYSWILVLELCKQKSK